ncbi:hypothetical protein B0T25DRAFT_592230 [Lasiosphaeria hispida]|uniref:Cupin type-1 domain-containing protein n=1 Tax=Lasiosphaeria hispida TaxID=260671 RepID=A0AAJ0HGB4_9PEZI|nr:hypothetical protein B0T25DRAFT_592230 [Lasiosphaeria hispida]
MILNSITRLALLTEAYSIINQFKLLPNDTQFIFNFNQYQTISGKGGKLIIANQKTFPALVGTRLGMVIGRLGYKSYGINTFHIHPQSAKLQLVIQGHLKTKMIPENSILNNNGTRRIIKNDIRPFQMTPFYQGSIYMQFNPNYTDTIFVASFANKDFGAGQVLDETFTIIDDIVTASFGQIIAREDINTIHKAIPASVTLSIEKCLEIYSIQRRAQ